MSEQELIHLQWKTWDGGTPMCELYRPQKLTLNIDQVTCPRCLAHVHGGMPTPCKRCGGRNTHMGVCCGEITGPCVDGDGQAGGVIRTKGWPPNMLVVTTDEGLYFRGSKYIHPITDKLIDVDELDQVVHVKHSVTSDAEGRAVLEIYPLLRQDQATIDGALVGFIGRARL